MRYLGGLDAGTTGCKIAVFDETGHFCRSFYEEYDISRKSGLHELDFDCLWAAVKRVLQAAATAYPLEAIGVTSFGESFVLLDENDACLAPAMLYTDPRGSEEVEILTEQFGEEDLIRRTGCKMHAMYSLPKLLWLKHNRPALFDRARRVLLGQDYLVYRLTGVAQIDYSLAARTAVLRLREKCWDTEILSRVGIPSELFSAPVPSSTVAGCIRPELAAELQIAPELKIVSGMHDQIASMVGAGITDVDTSMDGIGTVECVPMVFDEIPTDLAFYRNGYVLVPHINGNYACYAFSYAGGSTLKWFRDTFAETEKALAKASGKNVYAMLDAAIPDAPTGILALPYFAGAATPYMDNSATGAFIGLTFEHTKADIYKALMEGVSYEIRKNLSVISAFGVSPKVLRATGGGASSDVWLQIKADILNLPIVALDCPEVGAAGTVLVTGQTLGIFPDMAATRRVMVPERKTFYPNPEKRAAYDALFAQYEGLYDALRTLKP